RLGTWSTSVTCPGASVTIAQVSEAISLARRPAFMDNRNMGYTQHDAISCGIAGGGQVAQNGPLLGGTDNLGLRALHGDAPVDRGSQLIRELSEYRKILRVDGRVEQKCLSDPPPACTAPQTALCGAVQ